MVNFQQNLYNEVHDFKLETETTGGDINTSQDISGIEIRLSRVIIKDNKTPKVFPFPGYAEVYFLNVIISDLATEPISLEVKGFEKVDDGDSLSIDKTLYFWKKTEDSPEAPSQIHVMSSIIKSKRGMRETGEIMADLKSDDEFKTLSQNIGALVTNATTVGAISDLVLTVAGIVGKFLGKVDDKPLLSWHQSFTDINGDYDVLGKTEKHAENKYVSMNLSITIRDKELLDDES